MKRPDLRLPDDVYVALTAEAKKQHRSLHGLILHILQEWLVALKGQ